MGGPEPPRRGTRVPYHDRNAPALLVAVPGIIGQPPFTGVDIWNVYELSWLNPKGKPEVAIGTLVFPCDTPGMIESKSLKLYLNSFSQERVASSAELERRIARDVGAACGGAVEVSLLMPQRFNDLPYGEPEGESLDSIDVDVEEYQPQPSLLIAHGETVTETLISNLLKSNCPFTGWPDWGSLQVRYRGPRIDRTGLLRYVVSFRQHGGFHEQVVERMFVEIQRMCFPTELSIYARYTRRGGIDINPFRTNTGVSCPVNCRTARQ
jgi:7-cyano-7-deazaguanine reductase